MRSTCFALLLLACHAPAEPTTASDPPAVAPIEIEPDASAEPPTQTLADPTSESIGGIELGDPEEKVLELVGQPESKGPVIEWEASGDRTSKWSWSGLELEMGQVEGRVRVLRSLDATMEPGEILVVPAADIGWTPLFVTAGGLVSELGGPLSHACVAAREYGLPAVVNVRSATRALKTGDRVRLDGTSGTVELIGHA